MVKQVKKSTKSEKKIDKNLHKNTNTDDNGMAGADFVDLSDELGADTDDLTSAYARSKVVADDDSWEVVSTDDDDEHHLGKNSFSEDSEEGALDAIIADYAGIDGLAPEKSNDDKK
jgi:hypothetical protein